MKQRAKYLYRSSVILLNSLLPIHTRTSTEYFTRNNKVVSNKKCVQSILATGHLASSWENPDVSGRPIGTLLGRVREYTQRHFPKCSPGRGVGQWSPLGVVLHFPRRMIGSAVLHSTRSCPVHRQTHTPRYVQHLRQ